MYKIVLFALLFFMAVAPTIIKSQSLQFDQPGNWEDVSSCEFIVGGSHNLSTNEHIWVFLKDRYNHHYLQAPKVQFTEAGKWEAPNLRGNEGIRYAVAVLVSKKGNKEIERWVLAKRWGSIPQSEIEELKGYQLLTQVKWPGCTPPPDCGEGVPSPLLIADFEKGKTLEKGGKLAVWQSNKSIKVDWGIVKTETHKEVQGEGVGTIKFSEDAIKGKWIGGGLVIPLKANSAAMDLSCYQTVLFDMRIAAGSEFGAVRLKLEDSRGGNRPERLISNYGNALSDDWQRYRIPLIDLLKKNETDASHFESGDAQQIKKIVLVIVSQKEDKLLKGEVQIDNISFED